MNRHFTRGDTRIDEQALNTVSHQKMDVKTTKREHHIPIRMVKI